MTRQEAFLYLKENLNEQNLIKHSLAVEAVMRALALKFNKDPERWGLVGLLHDIDYERTKNQPEKHSLIGGEMLAGLGLDEEIVQAVKAHNDRHQLPLNSLMAKALYATDPLTGLIVAATLVLPSKKLKDLTEGNILNRFKEKRFASGANREIIISCENNLGLSLLEFVKIGLEAMQKISDDLEL